MPIEIVTILLQSDRFIKFLNCKSGFRSNNVTQQGKLVAALRLNERLVNNPDLMPHMDKILSRSEFRRYLCGKNWRYDLALHIKN